MIMAFHVENVFLHDIFILQVILNPIEIAWLLGDEPDLRDDSLIDSSVTSEKLRLSSVSEQVTIILIIINKRQ